MCLTRCRRFNLLSSYLTFTCAPLHCHYKRTHPSIMADEEDIEVTEIAKKRERPLRNIKVSECDMDKDLQAEVVEITQLVLDDALDSVIAHKDVAHRIKVQLDKTKGGTWHVIIGSHFGGNVTNDASTLINFQIDTVWYLAFRSGPPEKANPHSQ